jgi:cellulose synthase/poly-beta-1,6-N-acetylglucosamine synthase-like glycosyltransferase
MTAFSGGEAPTVDVVVSTFNEERYVQRCLDSVLGQDYPAERTRVILVDGGSSDGTVELARSVAERDERLTVIADGERRNLPASLNLAREHCAGELVAKVDAHGYPERDFLRLAAANFDGRGTRLACVGGRPVQDGDTAFGRAVALARTSRFGVGASEYAGSRQRALVDTVQCGVYRRSVLDELGWFNADMNFGEDEELNWRIREAGYDILLDQRVTFHYTTRPSWRAAYRQYRNYGEARVRVVREHPGFLRPYHLAPAALVASAAALAVAAPLSPAARRGLAALGAVYATGAGAAATVAARRREPALSLMVAAGFGALHLGYGVGTLRGLARLAADHARRTPQSSLSSLQP